MLDGRIASEYYADSGAGAHLVNPTNGRRFTDNKVWQLYYYNNMASAGVSPHNSSHQMWCVNPSGITINPPNYALYCNYGACGGGQTHYDNTLFTNPWNYYQQQTVISFCRSSSIGWID